MQPNNNVRCHALIEKEKEVSVTDLYNKGHTAREFAKEAPVSFSCIKKIMAKITGEDSYKETKKTLSIPCLLTNHRFQIPKTCFFPFVWIRRGSVCF